MSLNRLAACAVLGLAALVITSAARAQTYTVTDLGTLGGGIAFPSQISAWYITGGSLNADNLEKAFRGDSTSELTTLPGLGGQDEVAFGINDAGNAVGLSYLADHTTEHAVVWQNGHPIDLGTLPGGGYSEGYGDNIYGVVVGNSTTSGGASYHAFLWKDINGNGVADPGEMQDLGLLPGGSYSLLNAINAGGQAVGSADTVLGTGVNAVAAEHAILWDSTHGLRDLGTLGGHSSVAWAINAGGQVVGASDTASGQQHAFLWDSVHGMQDLGVLPGYDSTVAYSINDEGQVTGGAYNTSTQQLGGFVWDQAHGMRDINGLVPPGLGIHLFDVVNNNLGWLSAAGEEGNGSRQVFLLRPDWVPPPLAHPRTPPIPLLP